jgi:hypothetical protein
LYIYKRIKKDHRKNIERSDIAVRNKKIMAKLTRYTSFSKLKLSGSSVSRISSKYSTEISEFEEFINVLKKAALKQSGFKKKERPSNEQ